MEKLSQTHEWQSCLWRHWVVTTFHRNCKDHLKVSCTQKTKQHFARMTPLANQHHHSTTSVSAVFMASPALRTSESKGLPWFEMSQSHRGKDKRQKVKKSKDSQEVYMSTHRSIMSQIFTERWEQRAHEIKELSNYASSSLSCLCAPNKTFARFQGLPSHTPSLVRFPLRGTLGQQLGFGVV